MNGDGEVFPGVWNSSKEQQFQDLFPDVVRRNVDNNGGFNLNFAWNDALPETIDDPDDEVQEKTVSINTCDPYLIRNEKEVEYEEDGKRSFVELSKILKSRYNEIDVIQSFKFRDVGLFKNTKWCAIHVLYSSRDSQAPKDEFSFLDKNEETAIMLIFEGKEFVRIDKLEQGIRISSIILQPVEEPKEDNTQLLERVGNFDLSPNKERIEEVVKTVSGDDTSNYCNVTFNFIESVGTEVNFNFSDIFERRYIIYRGKIITRIDQIEPLYFTKKKKVFGKTETNAYKEFDTILKPFGFLLYSKIFFCKGRVITALNMNDITRCFKLKMDPNNFLKLFTKDRDYWEKENHSKFTNEFQRYLYFLLWLIQQESVDMNISHLSEDVLIYMIIPFINPLDVFYVYNKNLVTYQSLDKLEQKLMNENSSFSFTEENFEIYNNKVLTSSDVEDKLIGLCFTKCFLKIVVKRENKNSNEKLFSPENILQVCTEGVLSKFKAVSNDLQVKLVAQTYRVVLLLLLAMKKYNRKITESIVLKICETIADYFGKVHVSNDRVIGNIVCNLLEMNSVLTVDSMMKCGGFECFANFGERDVEDRLLMCIFKVFHVTVRNFSVLNDASGKKIIRSLLKSLSMKFSDLEKIPTNFEISSHAMDSIFKFLVLLQNSFEGTREIMKKLPLFVNNLIVSSYDQSIIVKYFRYILENFSERCKKELNLSFMIDFIPRCHSAGKLIDELVGRNCLIDWAATFFYLCEADCGKTEIPTFLALLPKMFSILSDWREDVAMMYILKIIRLCVTNYQDIYIRIQPLTTFLSECKLMQLFDYAPHYCHLYESLKIVEMKVDDPNNSGKVMLVSRGRRIIIHSFPFPENKQFISCYRLCRVIVSSKNLEVGNNFEDEKALLKEESFDEEKSISVLKLCFGILNKKFDSKEWKDQIEFIFCQIGEIALEKLSATKDLQIIVIHCLIRILHKAVFECKCAIQNQKTLQLFCNFLKVWNSTTISSARSPFLVVHDRKDSMKVTLCMNDIILKHFGDVKTSEFNEDMILTLVQSTFIHHISNGPLRKLVFTKNLVEEMKFLCDHMDELKNVIGGIDNVKLNKICKLTKAVLIISVRESGGISYYPDLGKVKKKLRKNHSNVLDLEKPSIPRKVLSENESEQLIEYCWKICDFLSELSMENYTLVAFFNEVINPKKMKQIAFVRYRSRIIKIISNIVKNCGNLKHIDVKIMMKVVKPIFSILKEKFDREDEINCFLLLEIVGVLIEGGEFDQQVLESFIDLLCEGGNEVVKGKFSDVFKSFVSKAPLETVEALLCPQVPDKETRSAFGASIWKKIENIEKALTPNDCHEIFRKILAVRFKTTEREDYKNIVGELVDKILLKEYGTLSTHPKEKSEWRTGGVTLDPYGRLIRNDGRVVSSLPTGVSESDFNLSSFKMDFPKIEVAQDLVDYDEELQSNLKKEPKPGDCKQQ